MPRPSKTVATSVGTALMPEVAFGAGASLTGNSFHDLRGTTATLLARARLEHIGGLHLEQSDSASLLRNRHALGH